MNFLLVFLSAALFVGLFKSLIKKYPVVFYGIAILIDVLFIVSHYVSFPSVVSSALFLYIQKCTFALALFTIVMFIGVFSSQSKIKTWLLPIRAELSIIAWFLSLGHMAMYLTSYVPNLMANVAHFDANILSSLVIALVLLVLLLVLGITSFAFVKKRLRTQTWKRIQLWAYPFFMLVYVHLLLLLLPAALKGGETAQVSVAVYSVIFISYAVLRIARAVKDRIKLRKPSK